MRIEFYDVHGPNGYLANFASAPFRLDGRVWPTVEHYFQAQKFKDRRELFDQIAAARSPLDAKMLAGQWRSSRDPRWGNVKERVMYRSVLAKFAQNTSLRAQLLNTGTCEIVETADDDWYWGIGKDGLGLNRMGHLLMRARAYILKRSSN